MVSDTEVAAFPIGDAGSAATLVWGRDDPAHFPDDGAEPRMAASFPPVGGCALAIMELAPTGDDFHEFVRDGLSDWAEADSPGMHRTATLDYDIVLAGTIGLELDNGVEVVLGLGDIVVQNGTRHRWHNRGETVAKLMSITIGARNDLVEPAAGD